MGSMTSIYVGVSGLTASQIALNTTTHNLANVYTEGYTRQLAFSSEGNYNTHKWTPNGKLQVGIGTNASSTSRVRDILLDLRYRKEIGRQGFYDAQYEVVNEIENIFGEIEGVQFQDSLEELWSAITEVAKAPDSMVYRAELVMNAETFIDRAKNIYQETIDYQKNLDSKIESLVYEINGYADQIYDLNKKIIAYEAGPEAANDYRDQRDLLLDKLSELVNVSYSEESNGFINVMAEGVPFVTGGGVFHIETAQLNASDGSTYLSCVWPQLGDKQMFYLNEPVTTANKNDIGTLKGFLLARGAFVGDYTELEKTKPENYDLTTEAGRAEYKDAVDYYNYNINNCEVLKVQTLFDNLIHGIVTTINDIMSPTTTTVPDGVTSYTDADGNVYNATEVKILDTNTSTGNDGKMPPQELFSREGTPRYIEVTGDDGKTYYMFNEKNVFGTDSLYTISNISINSAVQEDYTKLPFRTLEGDNDMAKTQAMVEIWNKTFSNLDPNNMTQLNFKEYYNEIVYAMGNDGDLYDSISQSQNDAVIEVEDARTQVTGVSSEEELSNMIRFQSAYNASSRYVTAVAEMLEYLIMKLGA